MPRTTSYRYGDIVLVPFPFSDQKGLKKRPAIVVSSPAYDQHRRDLIIMAVSSQFRPTPDFGEFPVKEWKKAGLIKPSVTKPVPATIEKRLVLRKLGHLQNADRATLGGALRIILGEP